MNDTENELARRLRDAVPLPPEVMNWGSTARIRAARTKRLKVAGVAAAACVAVLGAVTVPNLIGPSNDTRPGPAGTPTAGQTDPASPEDPPSIEQGDIKTSEGASVTGEWEDGEMLGEPIVIGAVEGHQEILYAARRTFADSVGGKPTTYVATGLRDGERVLRTVLALQPTVVDEADGVDLYGGFRTEWPYDTPSYRVIGSVKGDLEVRFAEAGFPDRPATQSSTTILPGYTVFYDQAEWNPSWDVLKTAPLTVLIGDERVDVRTRSWEG